MFMNRIFPQAIRSTPCLLKQMLFQPSKAYEFITNRNKPENLYISTWSFFFSGLFLGIVLALPHYFIYHDLPHSILFAAALAAAFTIAGAGAFAGAVGGAIPLSIAFLCSFFFLFVLIMGTTNQGIIPVILFSGVFAILAAASIPFSFELAFALATRLAGIFPGGLAITRAGAIAYTAFFVFALAGTFSSAAALAFTGVLAGAAAFANTGSYRTFQASRSFPTAATTAAVPIATALIAADKINFTYAKTFFNQPYGVVTASVLAGLCWFFFYWVYKEKIKAGHNSAPFFLSTGFVFLLLTLGKNTTMNTYDMILFPLAFMAGCVFNSAFIFNYYFKHKIKHEEGAKLHRKFLNAQKSTVIWWPLCALLFFLGFGKSTPAQAAEMNILAVGFAIMPVFFLRLPDYFFCLPVWLFQRKRILDYHKDPNERVQKFKQSLVFKHEMLFYQLPGLHKVLYSFAVAQEPGLIETAKQINYLYLSTFQQKQVKKAAARLLKQWETAHPLIHLLLESSCLPLLIALSRFNRLAELYYLLFEDFARFECAKKENQKLDTKDDDNLVSIMGRDIIFRINAFFFFPSPRKKRKRKREPLPQILSERVHYISKEMAKEEEDFLYNPEMTHTLEAAYKFLTAGNLKAFFEAVSILEKELPGIPRTREIRYFSFLQDLAAQLVQIKVRLKEAETTEQLEIKRSILDKQRQNLKALSNLTDRNLYEPFKYIWKRVLNCSCDLLNREIMRDSG